MGKGFDISDSLDFDFITEQLGTLRCRWAKKEDAAKIEQLARARAIGGEELARKLLKAIAYVPNNSSVPPATDDDGTAAAMLTSAQLAVLSPTELNTFCDQYIRLRLRIGPGARSADKAAGDEARGCDALAGEIVAHADARLAEMRKIVERFSGTEAVWKKQLSEMVAPFISGKSIADEMAKYSEKETAAEDIAKRYSLNSPAAQMALGGLPTGAAALLGVQAAFERMEASDRLGASIAAAQEPKHIVFDSPITMPQNPLIPLIRKTHTLLEQQLTKDSETALIHQNAAALLQDMAAEASGHTDFLKVESEKASQSASQASQSASHAMGVAIASIVVSVCVGIVSILYAREANQIANLSPTAEALEKQIAALAATAKLDRDQFEKQAALDRAAFAKAMSKANDKGARSATVKAKR